MGDVLKAIFVLLSLPLKTLADNCGSLSDCYGTVASAAAAIASLSSGVALMSLFAKLMGSESGAPDDTPEARTAFRFEQLLKNLWQRAIRYPSVWSALAGAFFDAGEKFKDWSRLMPSMNPDTGLRIPGVHLEYPLQSLGRGAAAISAGVALVSQFKESMEIWQSGRSLRNRVFKESASLSVNIGMVAATLGSIGALAATGPGMVAAFAAAAAIGAAGEGLKAVVNRFADRYIP